MKRVANTLRFVLRPAGQEQDWLQALQKIHSHVDTGNSSTLGVRPIKRRSHGLVGSRLLCLFLVAALCPLVSLSQSDPNCLRYNDMLTTDPNAPRHLRFQHRPNHFDWQAPTESTSMYEAFTDDETSHIISPFWQEDNHLMKFIRKQGTGQPNNGDRFASDGWELVVEELGMDNAPDGSRVRHVSNSAPYFILYHRFTGLLRLFLRDTDWGRISIPLNYLRIKHLSAEYLTNVIQSSTVDAPVLPLDTFGELPAAVTVSQVSARRGDWTFADFQTHFDPCACQSGARMMIEQYGLAEAQIWEDGRRNRKLFDISRFFGATHDGNELGSNHFIFNSGDAKYFARIYKSFASVEQAAQLEDTYVRELARTKAMSQELAAQISADQLTLAEIAKGPTSWRGLGTQLNPQPSNALRLYDFYVHGGRSRRDNSPITVGPFAAITDAYGLSFTPQFLRTSMWFNLPGANRSPAHEGDRVVPFYNNPLGVMAIVRTPTLRWRQDREAFLVDVVQNRQQRDSLIYWRFRIRLHDTVTWVVNPGAGFDLDSTEISAALVVDVKDTPSIMHFRSFRLDVDSSTGIVVDTNTVMSHFMPLGCLRDLVFQPVIRITDSLEPYVLPTFDRSRAHVHEVTNSLHPLANALRFKLKIMARLKPKYGSNAMQDVLFSATYPMRPIDANDTAAYSMDSWHVPLTKALHSTRRVAPEGPQADNGHAALQALSLTPTLGKAQNLAAGSQVAMPGQLEDVIDHAASGKAEKPQVLPGGYTCTGTSYPMEEWELFRFCNGEEYGRDTKRSKKALEVETSTAALHISPNPASHSVSFFVAHGSANGMAQIFNPQGERVAEVPVSGSGGGVWVCAGMPSGVYIIRVRTQVGYAVGKVIVDQN